MMHRTTLAARLTVHLTRAAALTAGTAVLTPIALAQDVLPAEGLVTLLPAGEIVGDGRAEAVLHAVLRTPTGEPVSGAKLKVTAGSGSAGEVTDTGDGVYRFTWRAPAVSAPTEVSLTLKGRADALGPVEATLTATVMPPLVGAIDAAPAATALVLGDDMGTDVVLTFPDGLSPESADDLLVRVSSGEVGGVDRSADGTWVVRYVAPKVNYPHLALVTVADRRNPSRLWGATTVALQGKVAYPVQATPGAEVSLRIEGATFGPVTADAAGRASVPVVVPPGVASATQINRTDAGLKELSLDLRVPAARRLSWFVAPPSVPSDARLGVPVHLMVAKADGSPDIDASPSLSATAGRLSDVQHVRDGVYRATWTPPDGRIPMTATIQAGLDGNAVHNDAIDVQLVPPMPSSVTLTTEPESLTSGGTALQLFASVAAADGVGLPERELRVRTAGADVLGSPTDLSGGDYRIDLDAGTGTDVLAQVIAQAPVSSNSVSHVVLLPSQASVDPGANLLVTVVTVDAFGQPVGDVEVALDVTGAGGDAPTSVVTDERGFAEVIYGASGASGVSGLVATAGPARGATAFWQATLEAPPFLPASGSDAARAVASAWEAAQATVYVRRDGGGPPPVGLDASVAVGDAPSEVLLTPSADTAAPGDTITLDIKVTDAMGLGVPGQSVELFATGGARATEVQDLGGGAYRATVEVPADAAGTIKLNVVVAGGAASTLVELPVSAAAVAENPWGVDTPPEEAVEEEEPKPEVDRPWMRLRASFVGGTYTYEQDPSSDPGGLLPQAIGWGGARGGAPSPLGVEGNFRGFLPQVPYLGLNADFRWTRYAVRSDAFSNEAVDNLYQARAEIIGRYPFAVGVDQIHVGVRAGFRYDDFITFRGCLEPGCSIDYEPLALPGLGASLELGAEFWQMYLVANGGVGFAYASAPYAFYGELNLGVHITKNLFVDAGFFYQQRNVVLRGDTSGVERGTLSDQQITGTVGVGFAY